MRKPVALDLAEAIGIVIAIILLIRLALWLLWLVPQFWLGLAVGLVAANWKLLGRFRDPPEDPNAC